MRTKIPFIAATVALIGLASCDKSLELTPHNGMTQEQLLKDVRGFEYAIRGCYSAWKNDGFYGNDNGIHLMGDLLSDNLMFNPQGRQTKQNTFLWRFSSAETYSGAYLDSYRLASRANAILAQLGNLPAGSLRDNFEGEALALRAIAHFELLRWFCKIPTQSADAGNSLGIYYQDTFNPQKKDIRRAGTTVNGSYARVVEDLKTALDKINDTNPDSRLDKQAVQGMLARVYLYMGEYGEVVKYADLCLAGPVKATPADTWADLWLDATATGAIVRIPILDRDRVAIGNPYSQTSPDDGTKSEYVCRKSLYDLYAATDCRRESIFEGAFEGASYLHVKKYFGKGTGNQNTNDIKYLRVEEVILSKAEAQYRLSQEALALATLESLRSMRYTPHTPGSETGQSLLDAIILERRLELAFEGDRFFTMKRLGMALVRDGVERERADGTGNYLLAAINIQPGDHRWQLAIPQAAISINPAMAQDQNPGY